MMVDADRDVLCQLLHRSSHEVESIQTACQRYVDDRDEYKEALSLLQFIQKDSQSSTVDDSTTNDSDVAVKRKRRK